MPLNTKASLFKLCYRQGKVKHYFSFLSWLRDAAYFDWIFKRGEGKNKFRSMLRDLHWIWVYLGGLFAYFKYYKSWCLSKKENFGLLIKLSTNVEMLGIIYDSVIVRKKSNVVPRWYGSSQKPVVTHR